MQETKDTGTPIQASSNNSPNYLYKISKNRLSSAIQEQQKRSNLSQ